MLRRRPKPVVQLSWRLKTSPTPPKGEHMDLVLIDGPNVFNSLARHLAAKGGDNAGFLREYFLEWFDFDRLVLKAIGDQTPPALGIAIFHSSKALSRGATRLEGDDCRRFWARQAGNYDTSDMIIDIPADQREVYEFECSKCAEKNCTQVAGEKGVDSAMIVHMFETAASWQTLAIFSRDADFAPAVSALRRRGKQVFAVGEAGDQETALGRASQSFFTLPLDAVVQDFGAFLLCRSGGVLDQWRAEVETGPYISGYFWIRSEESVVAYLKGALPKPHVELLRQRAAALPGILLRGDPSEGPRSSGLGFNLPLPFRRPPPFGNWSAAIVTDARQIRDPAAEET